MILGGCAAPLAHYEQAIYGGVVISPDEYQVNPSAYPRFRIKYKRLTPIEGSSVWMYPSDVWVVTHDIKGNYLIFSYDYNQRWCRKIMTVDMRKKIKKDKPCRYTYSAHVLIRPDGAVIGWGWVDIADPEKVVLRGDRMVNLPSDRSAAPRWGPQPSFQAIQH
jgi:hypothetical protein